MSATDVAVGNSNSFAFPMFAITPSGGIGIVGRSPALLLGITMSSGGSLGGLIVSVPNVGGRSRMALSNARCRCDRRCAFPSRSTSCRVDVGICSDVSGVARRGDAVVIDSLISFRGVCLTSIGSTTRLADSICNMPVLISRMNRFRCHTHCCGRGPNANVHFVPRGASFIPLYFNISRGANLLAHGTDSTGPVVLRGINCCRVGFGVVANRCGMRRCAPAAGGVALGNSAAISFGSNSNTRPTRVYLTNGNCLPRKNNR